MLHEWIQRRRIYQDVTTRRWSVGVLLVLVLIFVQIETSATTVTGAPESVLVRVLTPAGAPEENAECYGDIVVGDTVQQKKVPLRKLDSLYEVIAPAAFHASSDKGFYELETGFLGSESAYEVRVVCYAPNFDGVSYTIVDETNRSACTVATDGAVVIC